MSKPASVGFVQVMDCKTQHNRECCMHRSNTYLTTNPPVPIDVCCHCGTQIYRYDLQRQNEYRRAGHGPHMP